MDSSAAERALSPAPPRLRFGRSFVFVWMAGIGLVLAVIDWRSGRSLDGLHWWGVVTWIATYLVCVLSLSVA